MNTSSQNTTQVFNWTPLTASTNTTTIPREMVFSDDNYVSVVAYSLLFTVAAMGNLTLFITLCRTQRQSRVNIFILHLCIADMIVTFIMMPMEIAWHLTVAWRAGDVGCRIFMFFRTFGFYLSSFVLIAICLDRYLAIAHPLTFNDAGKRSKLMLTFAWCFSIIASSPQVNLTWHLQSRLYQNIEVTVLGV